jgi:NTP pyrophosphatase (non-canonical NTP hydrolase)
MSRPKGLAQVYQFPLPLDDPPESDLDAHGHFYAEASSGLKLGTAPKPPDTEVVISGTYRKDNEGLRRAYQELLDLGCHILSPTSVRIASEADGFVFMDGEQRELPESIEIRHLTAIQEAQFVWLHAPDGYVGLSAALEVGFAHAIGIPVYSTATIMDPILATFVGRVESVGRIVADVRQSRRVIPNPVVQAFQKYYKRAAIQRGYANENARDTLVLMVEEVGELARAIRKREGLQRHGKPIREDAALELADVFIYVVHMANVLGVDLSDVVQQKELRNIDKVLGHPAAK